MISPKIKANCCMGCRNNTTVTGLPVTDIIIITYLNVYLISIELLKIIKKVNDNFRKITQTVVL